MKKAVFLGNRKAALMEVPDPRPKEDWVVVKVHAAPMCTEYKSFVAGHSAAFLGHEAAGEVVAIDQPGRVRVGDRVVVMPQYPCGKCVLCVAGDYIHCEHSDDFVAQIRAMTNGQGVDKAIDCSGVPQAQRLCIDATRRKGCVTFIGECSNDLHIKVSPVKRSQVPSPKSQVKHSSSGFRPET